MVHFRLVSTLVFLEMEGRVGSMHFDMFRVDTDRGSSKYLGGLSRPSLYPNWLLLRGSGSIPNGILIGGDLDHNQSGLCLTRRLPRCYLAWASG